MSAFSNYIASFLLVIFARVMVPDALVLELHAHQHTEHAVPTDQYAAVLDHEHVHCSIEQVFHAAFNTVSFSLDPAPLAWSDTYTANLHPVWDFSFPQSINLRGPPAALPVV